MDREVGTPFPAVARRSRRGFTLAMCAVLITVMSIAVAAILPRWSTQIQREREAELIFRGLQMAEGIRVFQKRFGRYPVRLRNSGRPCRARFARHGRTR